MRARVLILALAASSLAAVPAAAQGGSVPADSAKHMAIRRLLAIQRIDSLMLAGIEQAFADQQPTADMPAGFLDSLRSRIRQDIPQFVERLVPVYDPLYTASGIQGLTTFYQSPVGQRYLAT